MSKIEFAFGKQLEDKKNIIIDEYYKQIQETEKYWNRDNKIALKIQSFYKKCKIHNQYQQKRLAAIIIQRNIRKLIATTKFTQLREKEINQKNLAYFSKQATIIQRHFRGFHERKYVHDFYARKQFLTLLKEKNENFLDDLYKKADDERIEEDRRQEAIARSEFNELAKNLHHLSSTHQTPGVYNPPYAHEKPTAFNIDVEMHLKATFKANYKWKPPTKQDIEKFKLRPTRPGQLKPVNRPNSSLYKKQSTQLNGTNRLSQRNISNGTQQSLRQTVH